MMKTFITFFALVSCSLVSNANPVNLSLIPDIAIVKKTERVTGFTLGIWSENPQTAFALGVVNGSTGDSEGVSFALLGNYSENYTGAHIGFVNWSMGHFKGAQLGTVNYSKKLTGLQIGFVNFAESVDSGIQIGLINIIKNSTVWFSNFPNAVAPVFPFINWHFE